MRDLVSAGQLPELLDITVKTSKKPVGGFALTVPPEIIIALLTSVATTTASEIIKLIWSELREFLKTKQQQKSSENLIVFIVNGQRHTFQIEGMPCSP